MDEDSLISKWGNTGFLIVARYWGNYKNGIINNGPDKKLETDDQRIEERPRFAKKYIEQFEHRIKSSSFSGQKRGLQEGLKDLKKVAEVIR